MTTAEEDSFVEALYPSGRDWDTEADTEMVSFINSVNNYAVQGFTSGAYNIGNTLRGLKQEEYCVVLMTKITTAYPQGIFVRNGNNLNYNLDSYKV